MENPLYSGQSIAVSRWVVGTVLLAVCQWVFFFFFEYCGQLPWNRCHSLATTTPLFLSPSFQLEVT